MKFWKKLIKRFAARPDKARNALKRSMALAMTQSILAERKHWVEADRSPRANSTSR